MSRKRFSGTARTAGEGIAMAERIDESAGRTCTYMLLQALDDVMHLFLECFMSVLNPIELFAQTTQMLANADCPQCGRKDGSASSPGRKDTGGCEWCLGRHQLLDQSKQWLQKSSVTPGRDRPRPHAVPQCAAGG
jgi:hypothetical protein